MVSIAMSHDGKGFVEIWSGCDQAKHSEALYKGTVIHGAGRNLPPDSIIENSTARCTEIYHREIS